MSGPRIEDSELYWKEDSVGQAGGSAHSRRHPSQKMLGLGGQFLPSQAFCHL